MLASEGAWVGLDYHTESVQVCVLNRQGKVLMNESFSNKWQVIHAAVVKRCGAQTPVFAALEACTGAANLAEELIAHASWSVNLAHPGYVSRMKQNPDKTDFSDARLLADLLRVGYLPKVWLAPEEVRELRRLVRHRQTLANERRNTKLRIGAALRDARERAPAGVNPWTKAWLAWLTNEAQLAPNARFVINKLVDRLKSLSRDIAEVESMLAEQTKSDGIVQKLLQQPGIGLVTAVTMRAEIGRFDRFTSGKQLSRFCGLTPCNASSGQRQADAGLIRAGNRQLRTVLLEAAHRLIRYQERWQKLHYQWRQRGKPGSLIAAAVANRWVRQLYHQMQPGQLTTQAA
jgi:transposase